MYQNFVLELDWRHIKPRGNSGVMVYADALPQLGAPYPRSVEVQVMDGDHGSIFGIRGLTLTPQTNPRRSEGGRAEPTEKRCRPAGEWNRHVLTSRDGAPDLEVNGKVVTRVKDCSQVKGYICLESEGSETHFRNLRLTPLAGSNLSAEKVAHADEGLRSIFDGISFQGWKHPEEFNGHWVAKNGIIACDGRVKVPKGTSKDLWTTINYTDFVLIADWRLPSKPALRNRPTFTPVGLFVRDGKGQVVRKRIPDAGDSGIHLRGNERYQVNIWSQPVSSISTLCIRTKSEAGPGDSLFVRLGYKMLACLRGIRFGFQDFRDASIDHHFGQPVGAQKDAITRLQLDLVHLDLDTLFMTAHGYVDEALYDGLAVARRWRDCRHHRLCWE